MTLSHDGKTFVIAEMRQDGLWISQGCACSLTMSSFVQTNIRGSDMNIHIL